MRKVAWFSGGFLACLFLGVLIPSVQKARNPYGEISYAGDPVAITSDRSKDVLMIGREGALLPYGVYEMKLKSGKILIIHKNDSGKVEVEEKGESVLINADENVIDVSLE